MDRRRTALQLEIARAAVALFTTQGVAATTGEQIARAVGISSRTFWRHFPRKESCVRPLLTAGLDTAIEALRHWPDDAALVDFVDTLHQNHTLPPPDPSVLELLRLACHDPALRPVWLQAHDEALPVLAELLARRSGKSATDLEVQVHAATVNSALRVGAEDFALHSAEEKSSPTPHLLAALRAAAQGLPY
ncbi:TetR/AcrR family transcriptional regulator [Streptomyces cyaneofuscatus]|uniref:TetR/AcrR family transcriptional regulator n=1 Tax=Streptomyces cyaneofuscatus TaxID=66883 RepID=UPI0033B28C09